MTTATPPSSAPPANQLGAAAWAKKNLFSSWFNTILTLISGLLLVWGISTLLLWGLTQADWRVIPANFRLLMVGRYPIKLVWRVWVGLGLVVAASGLTWGVLARNSRLFDRRGLINLGILSALLILGLAVLADPLSVVITVSLLALLVGLAFVGRQVGQVLPVGNWLPLVWLVAFVVGYSLIRGFLIGRPVKSDDLGGLLLTILAASVSIVLSFPLGVLLALGRRSELPVIRTLSTVYIEVIRGLPLITILFASQLLVPLVLPPNIRTDRLVRAVVGLTLFSAAYLAENVRGGLQAVPRGQVEASKALGINPLLTTSLIVMPQALKAVIPSMVGQFISLFKDTSLLTIIGFSELLGIGQTILANPEYLGRNVELYLFIGLIYWFCCFAMSRASQRLEQQLNTDHR